MQWLTADIVFDGYDFQTGFYVGVDAYGTIIQTCMEEPVGDITYLKGLLMPGMVNAHCHLELSHAKGMVEEKIGLSNFLQQVSKVIPDKVSDEIIVEGMVSADRAMTENGIVAVGDISNTTKTIPIKKESGIRYHSFIECIAIRDKDTQHRFEEYDGVYKAYQKAQLSASLSLHTPYTCNKGLYKLVNTHSNFISIHNQESEAENLLFERKAGSFDNFYSYFGLDKSEIIQEDTNPSSFRNSVQLLDRTTKKLFVHNTFTRLKDLSEVDEQSWFCFCPKANLYIEDQLPSVELFLKYENRIVLGTDSLASNDELNVLSEVFALQNKFPDIELRKLLQWSTMNGARLFGLEQKIGSLEVGKAPGFVNVSVFDAEHLKLLNVNCDIIQFSK